MYLWDGTSWKIFGIYRSLMLSHCARPGQEAIWGKSKWKQLTMCFTQNRIIFLLWLNSSVMCPLKKLFYFDFIGTIDQTTVFTMFFIFMVIVIFLTFLRLFSLIPIRLKRKKQDTKTRLYDIFKSIPYSKWWGLFLFIKLVKRSKYFTYVITWWNDSVIIIKSPTTTRSVLTDYVIIWR